MINNLDELLKLPEVELLKYLSENYTEQEIFELLDLTQDYADEEESRFFLYKPTPMAMLFHCSPAKIRWQYGANGSSKTIANIMEAHIQCSKMIPKSLQGFYPEERLKGSVICTRFITVDYPNGIEKIVKPLMQAFAPCKLEYSEDLRIFTYPNGAQCELMTYVQEIQAFMGVSRKLVIYDEEPPEHIHKENSARVARGDGQICASMTPESGITWSFDSIYQKAGRHYISVPRETLKDLNGNQVVKDGIPQLNKYSRNREIHAQDNPAGNPEIVTFHPTMYDNPYLSDSKINFMRTLCLTPEQEAIKVFGEFVSFTGLVLPEYNSSVNDYSPDLIQLEPDYPRYLFIDPHPQLPWAISLFCVDPRGIAYQEDELWVGGTMTDIVNAIKIFENMPVSANGKTGTPVPKFLFRKKMPRPPYGRNSKKRVYTVLLHQKTR